MTDLATDLGGTRTCPNCEVHGRLVLAHEVPAEWAALEAVGAAPDRG